MKAAFCTLAVAVTQRNPGLLHETQRSTSSAPDGLTWRGASCLCHILWRHRERARRSRYSPCTDRLGWQRVPAGLLHMPLPSDWCQAEPKEKGSGVHLKCS